MKKIIVFIAASVVVIQCAAQTRLTPGEIKGKQDTFVVYNIQQFGSTKYIGVYSKSNKYNNGVPRSEAQKSPTFLPMNPHKDIHVNDDSIKQIVFDVLKDKLDKLHKNQEQLSLLLTFEPDGHLTDVGFTLHANTLITIQEIENIDHLLRKDIKASFSGTQYKYYIAIDYYMPEITF